MAKRKFTNPVSMRTRTTGSSSAAYGGAVTTKKATAKRGLRVRGGFMGPLLRKGA